MNAHGNKGTDELGELLRDAFPLRVGRRKDRPVTRVGIRTVQVCRKRQGPPMIHPFAFVHPDAQVDATATLDRAFEKLTSFLKQGSSMPSQENYDEHSILRHRPDGRRLGIEAASWL